VGHPVYIARIRKLPENISQIHNITMFVKFNVARLMVYLLLESMIGLSVTTKFD